MDHKDSNKKDIFYIGMALIDSIVKGFDPKPLSASGYRAQSGTIHAGGEAVNGSVAAAKLGLDSGILCALAEDAGGDIVLGTLERYGVDTKFVQRFENHSTPVTTMLVENDGSRKSITNRTHAFNFHPERYVKGLPESKIVCLSSLFRAPFDDADIIFETVDVLKNNGAIIFADTKIPNFKDIKLNDISRSLPLIDYIFPNDDEAEYFTKKKKLSDMAKVFLDGGVKNVIIKCGAKGSYLKNNKEEIFVDAFKVDAIDTTGAGDNFIAGFAAELLCGKSHKEALGFANACGALSTEKEGALLGLSNRMQVEKFLEKGSV